MACLLLRRGNGEEPSIISLIMPIQFYQVIHLLGILMVFLSFGGIIVRSVSGSSDPGLRKLGGITNGIGLLLTLVGGFGLLAKLNYGFPGWIIVKLVIWFVFGGLIALINRKPELGKTLWWVILGLGVVAVVLVTYKPF